MKINNKTNKLVYVLLALAYGIPVVSFAALDGVRDLLRQLKGVMDMLIPIIFGLGLIYFFWGVSQFILNAGNEKARQEGKTKMLWGIIALFVMVSLYGIIGFIGTTLGINPCGNNLPGCTPGPF